MPTTSKSLVLAAEERDLLAALRPEDLSLLTSLWSCSAPATAGHLALLTGMHRSQVEVSLRELRSRGLLRTLDTVIESYLPTKPPHQATI